MRKILSLSLLAGLPLYVSAHTRWFADGELETYFTNEPTSFYLTVWAAIIFVVVLTATWLNRQHWLDFAAIRPKQTHVFERAASTFVMVAGTFFIIAGTHEYLFSPNLTVASGIPMTLIVFQILIGLAFLLGIASRVAGIALALLWLSSFYFAGVVSALENIWVLSTALFITLMGNEYFSIISFSFLRTLMAPYKKYALSVLRMGTGATLMVLGFSEKILAPEFGMNFLTHHDWNFMALLGFNYSDYLFTLSAGAVEFLFGLIFFLGLVTRINALFVAVIFSIPLFILGPIELAGHLPHFAAVVLLLLFGNGGHFVFMGTKTPKKHR